MVQLQLEWNCWYSKKRTFCQIYYPSNIKLSKCSPYKRSTSRICEPTGLNEALKAKVKYTQESLCCSGLEASQSLNLYLGLNYFHLGSFFCSCPPSEVDPVLFFRNVSLCFRCSLPVQTGSPWGGVQPFWAAPTSASDHSSPTAPPGNLAELPAAPLPRKHAAPDGGHMFKMWSHDNNQLTSFKQKK